MNDELLFQSAVMPAEFDSWVPVFARHVGEMRGQATASAGVHPEVLSGLFMTCLVINALDILSTAAGLLVSPDIQEQNAFAQLFIGHFGIAGGIVLLSLVKLGSPLALFLLLRKGRPWYRNAFFIGLCINTSAVLCAVANNCGVFFACRGS